MANYLLLLFEFVIWLLCGQTLKIFLSTARAKDFHATPTSDHQEKGRSFHLCLEGKTYGPALHLEFLEDSVFRELGAATTSGVHLKRHFPGSL